MPIKNYTTKVPANRSIQEIQDALVKHGAIGIAMEYEQGTGRIKALRFVLEMNGKKLPFLMPVEWCRFQAVLGAQKVSRWDDEDYCYRVAWRVIKDWVLAQMALCETEMVTLPQIFLPYCVTSSGKTFYESALGNSKLLGSGE